jgi:hypothetical protein
MTSVLSGCRFYEPIDASAIREKFGIDLPLIPDLLALVGDAATGTPASLGSALRPPPSF